VIIDVQAGFDDPVWGPTTNPGCEANVARLAAAWGRAAAPIVVVRHDSTSPGSPLHPSSSGNAVKPEALVVEPALTVSKHVNSAFYGTPELEPWLRERGVSSIVLCGIQTNMCVETTARMAGNLGFEVTVALDATRTFDLQTTLPDGALARRTAAELMATTAVNLVGGGFASVVSTDAAIALVR
jgi:nicotinamidase-related amidase